MTHDTNPHFHVISFSTKNYFGSGQRSDMTAARIVLLQHILKEDVSSGIAHWQAGLVV